MAGMIANEVDSLDRLQTPALLLDRELLIRNCDYARERCRALGVVLRPHMKTAKASAIARIAVDPAFGGIAVSTLREAEYFADAGITDIQYAVCIEPHKVERAFALANRLERFSIFVDSPESVQALLAHPGTTANQLGVWIEIDSGEHRTGLLPEDPLLVELARRIKAMRSFRLEGVATHGGHAYDARTIDEVSAIAEDERAAIVRAREMLASIGCIGIRTSVGSTPTLMHAVRGDGIDEFRAGVYMFGDLFQAGIHSLRGGDIALTVLTTVISRNEGVGRFLIDAGALALSKDRSTAHLEEGDAGYGELLSADGAPYRELIVRDVAQEHGFVDVPPGMPLPAVGTRLRVRPNHACMTAAMYDSYQVLEKGRWVASWDRVNGWGG
jgi:D-serine deaminase-like pyridoxal phosphate-dependent protein